MYRARYVSTRVVGRLKSDVVRQTRTFASASEDDKTYPSGILLAQHKAEWKRYYAATDATTIHRDTAEKHQNTPFITRIPNTSISRRPSHPLRAVGKRRHVFSNAAALVYGI